MAGRKGRKKRVWLDEEKRSICAQTRVPGVSVAQVAHRYLMNANLIHKWLRDPRFAIDGDEECSALEEALDFLPIEGAVPVPSHSDTPVSTQALTGSLSARRVDITLSDGRRILVEGTTALSAVPALVEGLMP